MKTINYKKAVLWGTIVLIIHMMLGNLLYMNPLVMGIFEQYEGHPSIKPMEALGGMGSWIAINAAFSVVYIIILIIVFVMLYSSIPGKGISKGLVYGLLIILVKAVPESFNQFMVFNYPTILIVVQFINAVIGMLFLGILLGFTFKKFGVITES